MATTKIEWADRVWNPVTGCTKVSEGCRNCYAAGIAIDQVSASNMRHVITGVARIVENALKGGER